MSDRDRPAGVAMGSSTVCTVPRLQRSQFVILWPHRRFRSHTQTTRQPERTCVLIQSSSGDRIAARAELFHQCTVDELVARHIAFVCENQPIIVPFLPHRNVCLQRVHWPSCGDGPSGRSNFMLARGRRDLRAGMLAGRNRKPSLCSSAVSRYDRITCASSGESLLT